MKWWENAKWKIIDYSWLLKAATKVEVFLDKRVRETRQAAGANSRSGTTKKREISRTLLSINLHFSVLDYRPFLISEVTF